MNKHRKIAFIFPGQGAQYPGMAQDFYHQFSAARLAFEEADEILQRSISKIILQGPETTLTETKNSQTGIFVASIAILRVIQELYDIKPYACAGLSLGEYTALAAGEWMPFRDALILVQHRGQFMNEACERTKGSMAVVLGLDGPQVEDLVKKISLPNDLWVANFNCPGQVVISGTNKGIEAGTSAAKEAGAKRVLPLQVHGAFHSGLMKEAQTKLAPYILEAYLQKGTSELVMNVPGNFVENQDDVRRNLIEQVTHSVRWEQGIQAMASRDIDLFIEIGPGKTLAGMNKRINPARSISNKEHEQINTLSIEKVEDLKTQLEKHGVGR